MIDEQKLLKRLKLSYFLRGLLNILFSILAFTFPNLTAVLLIYLLSINSLFISSIAIRTGLWAKSHNLPATFFYAEFLATLIFGLVALFFASDITLLIVYALSIWAIGLGLIKILSAITNKGSLNGVLWLSLAGWIYFFLGVYLLANPEKNLVTAMFLLAIASLLSGISLIMLSFRLKLVVLVYKKGGEKPELDK